MKRLIGGFIAAFLCIAAISNPLSAIDFVPVDQADVLVITHSELRTPGWEPDNRDVAWETQLLEQKAAQGYDVALLVIGHGVTQYFIRDYLVENQGSFRFVLIIGDARRPEYGNDPPNPMTVLPSDFANGNIVPFWREVIANPHYWPPDYANICESDQGYIAGIPNVSIGRIPAETRQEILDYLSKSDQYLADQDPSWSHRILEVLDDVFHYYNWCDGDIVRDYTEVSEAEFPPDWPVIRLATSTASTDTSVREAAFENEFNNNTPGAIHVLGTSGRADDLVNWYFGDSPYNFTNSTHLPFMVAMSCDLGGFDQYYGGVQRECVLEKLVLMPGGGLIGVVSATGWTIQTIDGVYCKYFWRTIFTDGATNFGEITNRSIERTRGKVPSEDFVLNMVTLLGDPTLHLQSGPVLTNVDSLVVVRMPDSPDMRLSWETIPGATEYRVYGTEGDPHTGLYVLLSTTAQTQYIHSGIVNASSKYFYRVKARHP